MGTILSASMLYTKPHSQAPGQLLYSASNKNEAYLLAGRLINSHSVMNLGIYTLLYHLR